MVGLTSTRDAGSGVAGAGRAPGLDRADEGAPVVLAEPAGGVLRRSRASRSGRRGGAPGRAHRAGGRGDRRPLGALPCRVDRRGAGPVALAAAAELLVLLVLLVGGLGYVLAGVLGKVFAEPILYVFWPVLPDPRAGWPLTQAAKGLESLTRAARGQSGERSAAGERGGRDPHRGRREHRGSRGRAPRGHPGPAPARRRARPHRRLGGDDPGVGHRQPAFDRDGPGGRRDASAGPAAAGSRSTGPTATTSSASSSARTSGTRWSRPTIPIPSSRPGWSVRPSASPRPATPSSSSRTCGGTAPRWPSCSTSTVRWPAWSRSRTCSSSLSARSTTSTTSPRPPTRSRPLGGTRFEVDATLPLEVLNDRFDLQPSDRGGLPDRRRPGDACPGTTARERGRPSATTVSSSRSSTSGTIPSAAS